MAEQSRRDFLSHFASGVLGGATAIGLFAGGLAATGVKLEIPPPSLVHGPKFSLFRYEESMPARHKIAMAEHVADMARGVLGEPELSAEYVKLIRAGGLAATGTNWPDRLSPVVQRWVDFMIDLKALGWEAGTNWGTLSGPRTDGVSIIDSLQWRIKPFNYRSIDLDPETLQPEEMTKLCWWCDGHPVAAVARQSLPSPLVG